MTNGTVLPKTLDLDQTFLARNRVETTWRNDMPWKRASKALKRLAKIGRMPIPATTRLAIPRAFPFDGLGRTGRGTGVTEAMVDERKDVVVSGFNPASPRLSEQG